MNSLVKLVRWDFTMQMRHGFWTAAAFVLVPWVAVLLSVTQRAADLLIPALIFFDISIAGTLFMAGVYFFEKREGSLQALVVTPLATWQWLTSKVVTLTVMGTAMCVVLVVIKFGIHAPWGPVLVAAVSINVLFILIGFILAAPNDKFTNFFLYYAVAFSVLEVPALAFFGISHPLFWILPSQPSLVLLRGAFGDMALSSFAVVLGVQAMWVLLGFYLCIRSFYHNVADRRGGTRWG